MNKILGPRSNSLARASQYAPVSEESTSSQRMEKFSAKITKDVQNLPALQRPVVKQAAILKQASCPRYVSAEIKERAALFAAHLNSRKDTLARVLSDYESYSVLTDEIARSTECLNSLDEIAEFLDCSSGDASVFFPLNLPIYSLVLFGVVPSFVCENVYLRPPEKMGRSFDALLPHLDLARFFPNIHLIAATREEFVQRHVTRSKIIIFTGKEQNARRVLKQCRADSLFLFNGWGCNPIVVSSDANIGQAVEKTLQAKVFNSGQDCAGPDTILLHRDVAHRFIQELTLRLDEIIVGPYADHRAVVGRLADPQQVSVVSKLLLKYQSEIIYGGRIDFRTAIVEPTIIQADLSKRVNYSEFFSPVFFCNIYQDDPGLELYFSDPRYRNNDMYVSVFGSSPFVETLQKSILIQNGTIHDVERGNCAYGGYSLGASFISKRGKIEAAPILIPKEIFNFVTEQDIFSERLSAGFRKRLSRSVSDNLTRIFRENLVFGFVFGGIAKNYATRAGDIDTMAVLKARSTIQEAAYIGWLSDFHTTNGFVLDQVYPTEILTLEELDEAVSQMSKIKLSLKKDSSRVYDQVVWGEVLAGRKTGLAGNSASLIEYTKLCGAFPKIWKGQVIEALTNTAEVGTEHFVSGQGESLAMRDIVKMDLSRILRRFVQFEENPRTSSGQHSLGDL